MLTIEGIEIDPKITALQKGAGFVVKLETRWNHPHARRRFDSDLQREQLVGVRLNGHEDTFDAALAAISTAINEFKVDALAFIDAYNSTNE